MAGSLAEKPDHLTQLEWVNCLRQIAEKFPNDPLTAIVLAVAESELKKEEE